MTARSLTRAQVKGARLSLHETRLINAFRALTDTQQQELLTTSANYVIRNVRERAYAQDAKAPYVWQCDKPKGGAK